MLEIGLTVGVVALFGVVALLFHRMVSCLVQTNERLMILVGTRDGGPDVGRALVAATRPPKADIPGVATPPKPKEGMVMTLGVA